MNIKQELEEMQEELTDIGDEAKDLADRLNNACWDIDMLKLWED